MESMEKFKTVARIILIGFVGAVLFHALMDFLNVTYPLNSLLFLPGDRFMDFFNLYNLNMDFNPYLGVQHKFAIYFPLSYLVFFPFCMLPQQIAFIVFMLCFCFFLYWFNHYHLKKIYHGANSKPTLWMFSLIFFLSYPVLFCLDRGNLDNLLFIFVALSAILFDKKKYYLSAFLLAIATAMKIYPFVFIILFIKERRWKEIFFCILTAVFMTLLTLYLFKTPGVAKNIYRLFETLTLVNTEAVIGDLSLNYSSSLFSLLKMVIWYLPPINHHAENLSHYLDLLTTAQKGYFLFTLASFASISLYVIFFENILWKQVMLLTIAMILFPYISADYKLIFLLIPFFMFITSKQRDRYEQIYTVLFAFLFIPKNYFFVNGPMFDLMPTYSIYCIMDFLNLMIMLIFVGLIAYSSRLKE